MKVKAIFWILAITLLAGCDAPSSKTIYPTEEWKKQDPEKTGFSMYALAQIDSLMKKANFMGRSIQRKDFNSYSGPEFYEMGVPPELMICANEKKVKVVGGYAFFHWSTRDLADVGYLYLNDGKCLPKEYVEEFRRSISISVMDISLDSPRHKPSTNKYGIACRGRLYESERTLWYIWDNGGQLINNYKHKPYTAIEQFKAFS